MKHDHKHRFRRPAHRPSSIDGIVPSTGQLGQRPVKVYRPDKTSATPSLGEYIKRNEGFHPIRPGGRTLATTPESIESDKLMDETIVLEDDFPKEEKKAKKKGHPRFRKVVKRGGLTILLLTILIGGFLGLKLNRNIAKVFHGNIFSILHTTKLKGEDSGRVTILLAGNSADDPGHNGAELTDSIMLISINTQNNTGYLVSIPRDLWVNYGTTGCQFGNSGKINAAYECGQMTKFSQDGYPSGGMGQLEKVINQDFGVNINYYALIDYGALKDGVNAVGGVPFTVNNPVPCANFSGLYDGNRDYTTHLPLVNLTNGTHVLNGQQALDLARARGDPPFQSCGYERGDFTRTQNQRQLLLNLKSKILSLGTISNPVKISSLLDVLGNNVQTDFHVDEVKRLVDINKNIPNNQLQSIGLADANVNLVRTGEVGNQSVVVPTAGVGNFSKIQQYLQRVGSNDQVIKEAASVTVLNGSNSVGLAAKTATGLTDRGLNVLYTGDGSSHKKTIIVAMNNKKPATKSYLEKKFGVTATTNAAAYPEAKNSQADFVIILGEDAANSQ